LKLSKIGQSDSFQIHNRLYNTSEGFITFEPKILIYKFNKKLLRKNIVDYLFDIPVEDGIFCDLPKNIIIQKQENRSNH